MENTFGALESPGKVQEFIMGKTLGTLYLKESYTQSAYHHT